MTSIGDFMNADGWDSRYWLPTFQRHNNPFLYMAYFNLLLRRQHPDHGLTEFSVYEHYLRCLVDSQIHSGHGLINRWPDGGGGETSHDELIGLSALCPPAARHVEAYLREHWGCYDNKKTGNKFWRFFRFNLYRFPWFVCYLRHRAGKPPSRWLDLAHVLYVRVQAWRFDKLRNPLTGSLLMTWLMGQTMRESQNPKVREAYDYWEKTLWIKGASPDWVFDRYLTEYPIFKQAAPLFFFLL